MKNEQTEKAIEIRRKYPSAVMVVDVQIDKGDIKQYIIFNSRRTPSDSCCVSYANEFGLELLTSARIDSSRRIIHNGHSMKVTSSTELGGGLPLPSSIYIKKNGGIFSLEHPDQVPIDVLLYFPKTNRYQITRATLDDSNTNFPRYYMDFKLLQDCCKKYGRPIGVSFDAIPQSHSGRINFQDLNDESVLKICGYSVAAKDGLSDGCRHRILELIVSTGILSVDEIISYLDFFISRRSDYSWRAARSKWQQDKEYIMNYGINTKNFVFGGPIIKR